MAKPLIAVTLGDPAGIGPEIVAKSIADRELFKEAACIVVGERQIMENAIRITGSRSLRTRRTATTAKAC